MSVNQLLCIAVLFVEVRKNILKTYTQIHQIGSKTVKKQNVRSEPQHSGGILFVERQLQRINGHTQIDFHSVASNSIYMDIPSMPTTRNHGQTSIYLANNDMITLS
ncbi:uncharacterized protein LOC142231035 [Haematobia irritans]|uniref:uncharacterized protein LOC142231035 n=1 Tax=Haematobia irritans TaxID=7368 RepID=UPI003F5014BE